MIGDLIWDQIWSPISKSEIKFDLIGDWKTGPNCVALRWLSSYLQLRVQHVHCRGSMSTPLLLLCGVPQGSVFLLYTADLIQLIEKSGLYPYLHAGDTQIYGFWPGPIGTQELLVQETTCISDVSSWMRSNRLQLNALKSETLWCASACQQHLIPNTPLCVSHQQSTFVTWECTSTATTCRWNWRRRSQERYQAASLLCARFAAPWVSRFYCRNCHLIGSVAVGLRHQHSHRHFQAPSGSTPVSSQCSGATRARRP